MLLLRLKLALVLFALGLLVTGFSGLGDRMRYRNPKVVSYADFVSQSPDEGWYSIKGGYLDLENADLVYGNSDSDYFVPLRQVGEPPDGPVQILVNITDDKMVHQIDAYNDAHKKPTTMWAMTQQSELGKPPDTMLVPMTISGMVNHAVGAHTKQARQLEEDFQSDNIVTIDKDVTPNALLATAEIIAGLMPCLVALWSFGIHPDFSAITEAIQARREASAPDLLRQNAGGGAARPAYTYASPPTSPDQTYSNQLAAHTPPFPQGQAMPPPSFSQSAGIAHDTPAAMNTSHAAISSVETAIPHALATAEQAPQEPAPAASKADEELARLKKIKAFDPFAE